MPTIPLILRAFSCLLAATIAVGASVACAAGPIDGMIELSLNGQRLEGMPVCWNRAGSPSVGPRRAALAVRSRRGEQLQADVQPLPGLFAVGVSGRTAPRVGRRIRSERDGPLSDRPSRRPARQMGPAVRRPVPLVRPLFLGPRLRARHAACVPLVGVVCGNRAEFARLCGRRGQCGARRRAGVL